MPEVVLCQPSLRHGPLFLPAELGDRFSCFPALGLLALRAGLGRAGICAEYLDAEARGLGPHRAAELIVRSAPRIVGIGMDSFTMNNTLELAREIKRLAPRTLIAVGGVHPTIYPEQTAALDCVDWAFCGEADQSFPAACQAWLAGAEPAMPGLARKRDGAIEFSGPAEPIVDLDSLPLPDWSGLELGRYFSAPAGGRPVLSLITSRGCPFNCTFCDRPQLARGLRTRSAELVLDELLQLKRLGAREASFYDDNLTADRKRAFKICELLARAGAPLPFDVRSRVDTVDDELLKALAAAGCRRIYFGVESGDPAVLRRINKGIDPQRAVGAFEAAARHGIRRLAYFMFGLPGEDRAAAERTIELAARLRADYYLFEIFIPMPATAAYDRALADGLIGRDYWAEQAARPDPGFAPPHYPGGLDPQQLAAINRQAYRRVLLGPRYVLRSLAAVRRPADLAVRLRGALDLLRMGRR